jgi:hypothetical protein
MTGDERRNRDATRKRQERLTDREIHVPPCANRRRRARYESNDEHWLRHYFGVQSGCQDPFWYSFTQQQSQMIRAIRTAILHGGDQALAASRGEGKTTIFERVLLKHTLAGVIHFSVLCASTGDLAANSLETIRDALETNELLLADYPEVCVPVRALENTPNRAHYQLVTGIRHDNRQPYRRASSRFSWCGKEIVLPNVPGSPAANSVIAARGLDAAVRGLKRKGRRPELVGIDDPDTEDTARSATQAQKLETRIDRALGGLGGQQKPVARVMLTTLQSRISASYRFTNPRDKPTWKGRRFRFLLKPPSRVDLWDEYIIKYQTSLQRFAAEEGDDEFARAAHRFYLENRRKMDAGAKVANKNRFDSTRLADGTRREASALQRYYNEVARIGQEAVDAEYDNNPAEESGPIESGITATRIQKQTSGYPRKTVPPGCTVLTQGLDIGKMWAHWVVRAWRPDATGYTIDYGVETVHGTRAGSDEGVDVAIVRAIQSRMSALLEKPYVDTEGKPVAVDLTLVDAGYRTDAVYEACRQLGTKLIYPAMGVGKSSGAVRTNFRPPVRTTRDRKTGDGWFMSRQPKRVWLVNMDADRWKSWEHDRWMTPTDKPGTLFMWGHGTPRLDRVSADEKAHHTYARHIVAEVEIEEVIDGALVRKWKAKRDANHWLDASYMADVAANMKGIRLLGPSEPKNKKRKSWYS